MKKVFFIGGYNNRNHVGKCCSCTRRTISATSTTKAIEATRIAGMEQNHQ